MICLDQNFIYNCAQIEFESGNFNFNLNIYFRIINYVFTDGWGREEKR